MNRITQLWISIVALLNPFAMVALAATSTPRFYEVVSQVKPEGRLGQVIRQEPVANARPKG